LFSNSCHIRKNRFNENHELQIIYKFTSSTSKSGALRGHLQKFAGIIESEEIKMRKEIIVSALMAASVSLPAMANDEYFDQARVLAVTPQLERVNYPTQSCHTEYVRESYSSNQRSPLGAIIGGVAGGLLGSQIGKGNGRVA